MTRFALAFRSWIATHRLELGAAAFALVVYAAFSAGMLWRQSEGPHFVYQAAGFLRGELAIPTEPPNYNDWVRLNDRWFVSFPPFPAVLMTPFVALHGLQFNDVFFTVCLAALSIGLFVLLQRKLREQGEHERTDREMLLLTAFLAFGTVYFPSAIRGEVWFTAHVVGVSLTCLYVLASLRARHPVWAGLLFGLGATTRANLVFAFPFFLLEALVPEGRLPPWSEWPDRLRRALPRLVIFGLSAAFVLGLSFWMNHERFGNWLEFGHGMLFNNRVNARVREHGLFDLSFFAENFRSAFLLLPRVSLDPLRITYDPNGLSLLLTTPLLVLVPFAARRSRLTPALAITAVCVAIPGLFYMNNGYIQFGFRFSNDWMPYVFLLLLVGGRPMNRTFLTLGALGVLVCAWGAVVFHRP